MNAPTMHKQSGFTLLELLVTLTILSAMAAMLFGSFRMSVKAWQRGDEVVEDAQRFRIMLQLVRRQLSCAYALNINQMQAQSLPNPEDPNAQDLTELANRGVLRTVGPLGIGGSPFFNGTSEGLEFTGLYPLKPFENRGLLLIRYSIESSTDGNGRRLVQSESRYFGTDSLLGRSFNAGEERTVVLFENLEEAKFEYYGIDVLSGEGTWEDRWDSAERDGLPKAVALDLRLLEDVGKMGLVHRVVVPIIAESFRSRTREGARGLFQQQQTLQVQQP